MPNYTIGVESGSTAVSNAGDYPYYYEVTTPYYQPQEPILSIPSVWTEPIPVNIKDLYDKCKGGDENMRYLYEVILVNPKNGEFYIGRVVARSETSALMAIYAESNFIQPPNVVPFDDLKTSCRALFEWKKEKSLKKAIETIKKAVE